MLHRILFPVLFFAISILLLNSIGKEVSTQNIEKMRFVIFDNNMNVTYYTSNVSFGNAFIGDSCDAFNEYDGKYIKYNPRFVYDSPCYENSGKQVIAEDHNQEMWPVPVEWYNEHKSKLEESSPNTKPNDK